MQKGVKTPIPWLDCFGFSKEKESNIDTQRRVPIFDSFINCSIDDTFIVIRE